MASDTAITATAVWEKGLKFVAHTETGHQVVMDGAEAYGGQNAGPRPMELLLVALAGCTGMDVVSILQKMRQPVTGYRLRVTGERAPSDPHKYTHILVEHLLQGDLDEDKVAHAVELSDTKYCSVAATLRGVAQIDVRWTIER